MYKMLSKRMCTCITSIFCALIHMHPRRMNMHMSITQTEAPRQSFDLSGARY